MEQRRVGNRLDLPASQPVEQWPTVQMRCGNARAILPPRPCHLLLKRHQSTPEVPSSAAASGSVPAGAAVAAPPLLYLFHSLSTLDPAGGSLSGAPPPSQVWSDCIPCLNSLPGSLPVAERGRGSWFAFRYRCAGQGRRAVSIATRFCWVAQHVLRNSARPKSCITLNFRLAGVVWETATPGWSSREVPIRRWPGGEAPHARWVPWGCS